MSSSFSSSESLSDRFMGSGSPYFLCLKCLYSSRNRRYISFRILVRAWTRFGVSFCTRRWEKRTKWPLISCASHLDGASLSAFFCSSSRRALFAAKFGTGGFVAKPDWILEGTPAYLFLIFDYLLGDGPLPSYSGLSTLSSSSLFGLRIFLS